NVIAIELDAYYFAAGVNRRGGKRSGERLADAPVASPRIEKAAIEMAHRPRRKHHRGDQRSQVHPLQPPRGHVGREFARRQSPELFRVVEKNSAREGLAELPQRAVLEADDRPGTSAHAHQLASDPEGIEQSARENDASGRRGKIDEPAALPNLARGGNFAKLAAEQVVHVARDFGIAIVKAVSAAIVSMSSVAEGAAHASDIVGSLEKHERHSGAGRIVCDRKTGGPAAKDGQMIHRAAGSQGRPHASGFIYTQA